MTNPFGQFAAQDNQAPAPETNQDPAPQAQPEAPAQDNNVAAAGQSAQAQNNAQAAAQFNNAQGAEAPKPAGNLADMFNNGAVASSDKFTDDLGQAVLIRSKKFISQMNTQFGPTDAMEADWIVLDGPNQGAQRSGLIFSTVIVNSLQTGLENGRPFTVGVISRAETAKPGQSPAYLLNQANEDQVTLAGQAAQAFGWV